MIRGHPIAYSGFKENFGLDLLEVNSLPKDPNFSPKNSEMVGIYCYPN
jgi:hypothetical protein